MVLFNLLKPGRTLAIIAFALYLVSCGLFNEPSQYEYSYSSEANRYKIDFGNNSEKTITLENLSGRSVFLVTVNTSGVPALAGNIGSSYSINTARSIEGDTGSAEITSPVRPISVEGDGLVSGAFTGPDGTITRLEHPGAREFSRNPPALPVADRSVRGAARSSQGQAFSYAVGASRQFWVEDKAAVWKQIEAKLRASSTHANVWIPDENYNANGDGKNTLSYSQAQAVAVKFDAIYQYDTAIFGYEYGGNLSVDDPNYGGIDGDPKIQILVYDIDGDYTSGQTSGIFGYFWGKDLYKDGTSLPSRSNEAEIFYIDSYFTESYPDAIYSTLAHEFQHMINFNVKRIEKGLSSGTWYDEMLSMLAEDMIVPLIGIGPDSPDHPIKNRIPLFLSAYWYAGPAEWSSGDNVLISYSNTYAFGAYLARNYGGAGLIREIARNNAVNKDSVDAALKIYGSSWDNAVSRYGEAFIFSGTSKPSGCVSFDNTVSSTINGTAYTFAAFDIWKMLNRDKEVFGSNYSNSLGPAVFEGNTQYAMRPYSVLVRSYTHWRKVNGNITITVRKPVDTNIELYVMTR
ncbi:MAG: hypothetical protein LBQ88_16120 [Treponema sp.]|jgi:hypothetical protein|nr:hypothetical protein [Treponema sp.]